MQIEKNSEDNEESDLKETEPLPPPETESTKDAAVKIMAIIGLAVVLAIVSFIIVKYLPSGIKSLASSAVSFSSRFIPSRNNLSLSSDKYNINSGENFNLSWNTLRDQGQYTLSYSCVPGVHLESIGSDSPVLDCNVDYQFLNNEKNASLSAFSTETREVVVPIILEFTKQGENGVTKTSEVKINILNSSIPENIVTTTPGQSYTPSPTVSLSPSPTTPIQSYSPSPSPTAAPKKTPTYQAPAPTYYTVPVTVPLYPEDPNGKPDLSITILETGILNPSTNTFTRKSTIDNNDHAAVRFEITNIGTKRTGAWRFESRLPTKANYTYRSADQISLMPQDKIEFILGFDEFEDTRTLNFTIEADPDNRISESNERNNNAYVTIRVDK